MKVREETLMRADFTSRELGRIKNISQRSGDTLGEAISDLARRFIITAVAVTFCLVVFFVLLILAQPSRLSLVLSVWLAALPLQHSPSHLLSLTKPGVSDALSAADRCFCCREAVR
ncbi:hypothetical protein KFO32_03100 [Pantoea ananatis]|uniref:hypothetical protein n=1 Tax=Pantoea ananas TaxID=553 RepID=UPI001FF1458F|nr:hypothetical protein [Pantoea ananatis]MCK0552063.1 hypothetical protein [Pantoea ananatis]